MSFCGPSRGKYDAHHFNINILYEIAPRFCECIVFLSDPECPEY